MRPPAEKPGTGASRNPFLEFIRAQIPAPPPPPATAEAWERRLAAVRAGLSRSFGRMPAEDCDLDPEVLGTVSHEGLAIERLTFQSRPGVRVTANLYRPEKVEGRTAGVLSVHGHWAWARMDPHVQARCLGLAKLGYVVLAVDAFGAGERAIEPKAGTYHGALQGASLWPSGVPLLGLQVYDNRRAVDYLVSRPEVDASKLAITGASGGGNQSLYAGATDPRLAAVVPVCGVGTLASYVGAACCVCEMLVGGTTYATTGDLLALIAPRALLVINATRDAVQFSVGEARKSVAYAAERFKGLDVPDKIRQLAVESDHDYNREMREALYGWLDRWLRGQGDGSPAKEPASETLEPTLLRCYPDGPSRPKSIATIPAFAHREGLARLGALPPAADHPQRFEADALRMRTDLRDDIFGGFPKGGLDRVRFTKVEGDGPGEAYLLEPEPGLKLRGVLHRPDGRRPRGTALLLRREGVAPLDDPAVKGLLAARRAVLTVDLRAASSAPPSRGMTGHNEAEWSLWVGRPLLGQWVWDALRWLDALEQVALGTVGGVEGVAAPDLAPATLVGSGPFGLVALVAGGMGARIEGVAVGGIPASFVGENPWEGWDMGLIVPNILDVGDVGHLASLVAPARLAVAGGVEPDGKALSQGGLNAAFAPARAVYKALKVGSRLDVSASKGLSEMVASWDD